MKIGLYGGTFDPIHWGHLRSAEEVREAFALDRVLFIPASTPPHKRGQAITPARHRLAMVRLAVARHRAFAVSTVEIERAGVSYTIDTLRHFARSAEKHTYYFILGLDAFREIDSWKDFRELFPLCNFIVTSRPGSRDSNPFRGTSVALRRLFCYDSRRRLYRHRSGTQLFFLKLTDLAISASAIREKVRRGQSIRYLVPLEVEAYIEKNGLYRGPRAEKRSS
ncbi:MAG TPA: nicotinate-nucleotide adenylyltransferase [candidate division Zixibacteria bacterium]|nr:nicotinate-nucleotide adenylyltransferase [candidate division Zixibacteria bacterium]